MVALSRSVSFKTGFQNPVHASWPASEHTEPLNTTIINWRRFLEAIRKPTSNVMPLSSSILAVMQGRTLVWSESMQHKMHMTALDHRRTRCDPALIVLTVAPIPPMPRVCARNHPAFRQWGEAFSALGMCLHLDAPPGPRRGHPGVQRMVVILLIRKDRHETREVLG